MNDKIASLRQKLYLTMQKLGFSSLFSHFSNSFISKFVVVFLLGVVFH